MPVPALKNLGIPLEDAERYWNDAKKEIGKPVTDFTNDDWKKVMGITKIRAKEKQEELRKVIRLSKFVESDMTADQYIESLLNEDELPPTVEPDAVDDNIAAKDENIDPMGNTSSDFKIPNVIHKPGKEDINVSLEIDRRTGEDKVQGDEKIQENFDGDYDFPDELRGLFND